jgi:hypothetical protein
MATITKTQGTSLLALASIASNTVSVGSAVDVSTKLACTVFIHFGRRAATALTEGMEFRIEASAKSSGDGFWWPLTAFKTQIATSEAEAVSGTVTAGTNIITVASTANLVAGDLIYIDNGTIGNSEWGRIKSISSNTSVTIEDNLLNAQTGATIYDQAEYFVAQLDLTAIGRIRIVADGRNTGQAVAAEAFMATGDSIG